MRLELTLCDRPPADLRERYFRSLREPQASYVEKLVAVSQVFRFGGDAPEDAGYVAAHDGAIVEFFAGDAWLPRLSEAFYAAADEVGATAALVKSYDGLAIAAVTGRPTQVTTIGIICTSWADEAFAPPSGFVARAGEARDGDLLLATGLFDTPVEAQAYLDAGQIIIYAYEAEPVGCGLLEPVRAGADVLDLGVGVLPAARRRGFGEQIIRHLKAHCLQDLRLRPFCGCAVENVASRRTLERAGFLTRHRLLSFSWGG